MPRSADSCTGKREGAALALARGLSVQAAAQEAGISERTLFNWRAEPVFAARVQELRGELFATACGKLCDLASKAADKLGQLADSDVDSVSLGACRTIIDAGLRLHESLDLESRLAALEAARGAS